MNTLAADWTAVGSIATGISAIAAFLTIAATVLLYWLQSRGNKAAVIRRTLQNIHSQETQVTRSIESGFLATIDRQIREFRERLGPTAEPRYFLDQLFGNGRVSGDRPLFKASALESNLSSTMYIRMSDIWDEMNMNAFEFRGALRIFSYMSWVLTQEARRLCEPENTTRILDIMAEHRATDTLSKIHDLDRLVNNLLANQIKLATCQLILEESKIRQGCAVISTLADKALRLSDRKLLRLAGKNVDRLGFDKLDKTPHQTIKTSLGKLRRPLSKSDLADLYEAVDCWCPQPDTLPAEPHLTEQALPNPRGRSALIAILLIRSLWPQGRVRSLRSGGRVA